MSRINRLRVLSLIVGVLGLVATYVGYRHGSTVPIFVPFLVIELYLGTRIYQLYQRAQRT